MMPIKTNTVALNKLWVYKEEIAKPHDMRNVPSIPEMEPFNIILDIYINQPFLQNNLWYEIKANPRLHFRTMVLLARYRKIWI